MPTKTTSASAPVIGHTKVAGVGPLAIAAALALVLHLVSGMMLDRSHASPGAEPATSAASDDQAMCATETIRPEPSLPYD